MLADISYESAFDKVYKNGKVDHTEICDLKRALVSLGLKTAYRTVKIEKNNLEKLAVNAIVKTAPRRDGSWHWMVWDSQEKKLIDPKIPPYKRPRIHAYLGVTGHFRVNPR